MNLTQIDMRISTFNNAISVLSELKEEMADVKPMVLSEPSAATSEVYLRTEVLYSWTKLKKWCTQNNIKPVKKDHYGVMINHYPASAWMEVFGVGIVEVMSLKPIDEVE